MLSNTEKADAVIEVAKTIVGIGCKIVFGPVGALADPFVNVLARRATNRLEERRVNRMLETCVDIIADQIMTSLGEEYRDLNSNEYIAAIIAVKETLEKSLIDTAEIVRLDLNVNKVRHKVQPISANILRMSYLSESGSEFYRRVLRDSCAYLVQFVVTLPGFTSNALQELLRRETQILENLAEVLKRMPKSRQIDDFEVDYRQALMNKLDRMELFGVNIDEASANYPLSVAYVSLQVLRRQQKPASEKQLTRQNLSTGSRVEETLAISNKTFVIGEAGSGKTTLLRYIAVSSAVKRFTGPLESWNERVPFYIPLRRYVDTELPTPGQFPVHVAANIVEEMPAGWVHRLLRDGKAVVLVDGVDEMPEGAAREKARVWLRDLVGQYPEVHYVVTSRPGVVNEIWPPKTFAIVELQPMSLQDIQVFVRSWHAALRKELAGTDNSDQLTKDERAILSAVDTDRNLRRLAVNPLLCALLCALNRERKRQLPKKKMEIYAAALEMLLTRRDPERGIDQSFIEPSSQRIILRVIAFWLFRQGLATAPIERVESQVKIILSSLSIDESESSNVVKFLTNRSGLLREPSIGRIDFIHRTFQEYLAAEAAVYNDEIELLIKNAQDDQWREVIIMAVGHAQQRQRESLLRGLIAYSRKEGDHLRITLLTVACLQTAPELDSQLRHDIEAMATALIPPKSMEAAESLAPVGALALEVLESHPPHNKEEAAASVRLAAMVGGKEGLHIVGEIASTYTGIGAEIIRSLVSFDPVEYAERVFSRARLGTELDITGSDLLPHIGFLTSIEKLRLDPLDLVNLTALGNRPPQLTQLTVKRAPRLEIYGLERWNGLTYLAVIGTHTCPDLSPIASITTLKRLRVTVGLGIGVKIDLTPLTTLSSLNILELDVNSAATIDLAPVRHHDGLVIKASRSLVFRGIQEYADSLTVIRVDDFPA